jgi:hypothetical protein
MSIIRILCIVLVCLQSCSVLDGYRTKDFVFQQESKREHLQLKIPKGFAEEKIVLDSLGGKEQYYYYASGALLYFSKDVVSWTSENQPQVDSIQKNSPYQSEGNYTFQGMDKDKLHWKEIRMDNFRFGYSYVPKTELDKFETAINSIRFK